MYWLTAKKHNAITLDRPLSKEFNETYGAKRTKAIANTLLIANVVLAPTSFVWIWTVIPIWIAKKVILGHQATLAIRDRDMVIAREHALKRNAGIRPSPSDEQTVERDIGLEGAPHGSTAGQLGGSSPASRGAPVGGPPGGMGLSMGTPGAGGGGGAGQGGGK